jgi:hypothetical protein
MKIFKKNYPKNRRMKIKPANIIILVLIILTLLLFSTGCSKAKVKEVEEVAAPEPAYVEPVCGNNITDGEDMCDGKSDKACPGRCIPVGLEKECQCYGVGESPKELCQNDCMQSLALVQGMSDYVSYTCTDKGFCSITVKPETVTTKKYLDQFTLGCGYKIVLRSEVDAPFLKGGKIRFQILVEDFNPKTCKDLNIRTVSLMDSSEVLADIYPEETLPELDSSLEDQFVVTYETKEMAESRYVVLRVFYSYTAMYEEFDENGKAKIVEVPMRETADLQLAVPLIVVNPGFKSEKYEIIYNPKTRTTTK